MYWFLYKDFKNENSLFYNWDPSTLRYTLNAKEANEWYEKNKELMVSVNIKRPPNLEMPHARLSFLYKDFLLIGASVASIFWASADITPTVSGK